MFKVGFYRIVFICFFEIWWFFFFVEGRSNIEFVKRGGLFFGIFLVVGVFDFEGFVFGGRVGE